MHAPPHPTGSANRVQPPVDRTRLTLWSKLHAVLMLAVGTGLAAGVLPPAALAAAGGLSFALLMGREWERWRPGHRTGMANWVTLARLAGVMAMLWTAAAGPRAVGTALLLWALDGLDGWLARRHHCATRFGDLLDKETDAFFTLALTALLHAGAGVPAWILLGGLLRYGFVLAVEAGGRRTADLPSLPLARLTGSAAMVGLILGLRPMPPGYLWVLAGVTAALGVSFLASFWILFRRPRCPRTGR